MRRVFFLSLLYIFGLILIAASVLIIALLRSGLHLMYGILTGVLIIPSFYIIYAARKEYYRKSVKSGD